MSQRVSIKDPYNEKRIYGNRLVVVLLAISAMLLLLMARYFSLQVLDHEIYRTQSDRNRVQLQAVPPKRGLIYDRNGILLAENIPSYELTVVKEQVGDLEQTLSVLQSIIDLSDEHIAKFKQLLKRRRAYQAVTLKSQLTEDEIASIAVNRYRLPGVDVGARLSRYYPHGEYFAHVLGYVGRINESEQALIDEVDYSGTHYIGKIGIEKHYEELLHGEVGNQNVETNARGRILRVLERTDPEPGQDIYLHLDAHVQKVAHDALKGERGAVVAIDPKTGGVLAMVSTPSFDPNLFVNGISNKNYSLLRDSLDLPLFNRSLQGQYPPGSTVKPIFGLAGLHYGVVTPQTKVRDPGWYQLPNDERLYRDWTWRVRKSGHAKYVQIEQAITESCDTYFWSLAYQLGIDRIHDFSAPFGFGSRVEIDNTNERSGLLPSRKWKRQMKRSPWFPGETLSVGIGQGYMLTTPLQLATAFSAVANKGTHFVPQLLQRKGEEWIATKPKPSIVVDEQHWQTIFHAMKQVVHGRRGSANSINRGAKYKMAGKTGTAQVIGIAQGAEYDAEQIAKRQRDHALFVGFAPFDNPKIVVAAIIENGEKSSRAAKVVRKVFDAWLIDQDMMNKDTSLNFKAKQAMSLPVETVNESE
ncbi:MAG: penicillin-binding protein 2 [Pseudohongiellaceae bacterium]|jgi:penicillin-binding protein 2